MRIAFNNDSEALELQLRLSRQGLEINDVKLTSGRESRKLDESLRTLGCSASVDCNGDGTFTLRIHTFSEPGLVWARWYSGATDPLPSPPGNPFSAPAGNDLWTMHPVLPSSAREDTVTPPAGEGVRLVVWFLPTDGSAFAKDGSGFVPACNSSSSSSSSSLCHQDLGGVSSWSKPPKKKKG